MAALTTVEQQEVATLVQAQRFFTLGRYEFVLERSGYNPAGLLEVWRDAEGETARHYNSPHYFMFGMRLHWSRTK
jgi:hypothetical protein